MTADFGGERVDLARESDFRIGGLTVRPAIRQVESDGASETLEPRIMQVLVVLARRRGQVVSRDELTETCWEGRAVGDDALNRCTARVRKLGEVSAAFRLETIPRVGYRLHEAAGAAAPAGPGAPVSAAPPAEAAPPVAVAPGTPPSEAGAAPGVAPTWLSRPVMLAGGALLAVILAAAAWIGLVNWKSVVVASPLTLAVLPFQAEGDDPQTRQLAAAIPLAIADQLTAVGMSVIPPSRLPQAQGPAQEADAAKLGARFTVGGTVLKSGDRARVVVHVDHLKRGVTIWSISVDGPYGDPGALSDQISANVARSLSWSAAVRLLNSDRPDGAEIASSFLQSIQVLNDGKHLESLEGARRTVRLAPDVALGHVGVAIEAMRSMSLAGDRAAQWREAVAAADEARRLDPNEGDGFTAKMLTLPTPRWAEKIALQEQAPKVDAQSGSALGFLNGLYLSSGRLGDALAAVNLGRARDSLDGGKMVRQAQTFLALGDLASARKALAEVDRRWPALPAATELKLSTILWWGDAAEIRQVLAAADAQHILTTAQSSLVSQILAARPKGDRKAMEAIARSCAGAQDADQRILLICLSAGVVLGDPAVSFAAADRLFPDISGAIADDGNLAWLETPSAEVNAAFLFMPWMAPMRADPNIIPVFKRLGLQDYWKSSGAWPDFCEGGQQPVCGRMKAM